MSRLRDLLRQREFQISVFCLSLLLFSWPLVSEADLAHIDTTFLYLFGCWVIVIILQFLISRCVAPQRREEKDGATEL